MGNCVVYGIAKWRIEPESKLFVKKVRVRKPCVKTIVDPYCGHGPAGGILPRVFVEGAPVAFIESQTLQLRIRICFLLSIRIRISVTLSERNEMLNIVFLISGILLLTGGGEILIRGALSAARRLGVSPLLSGLVIVGFGTSAPELVVSVDAAIEGRPDIALGNVVGSNIGNILLILGICALITPAV